jgi:hypothetical protein
VAADRDNPTIIRPTNKHQRTTNHELRTTINDQRSTINECLY